MPRKGASSDPANRDSDGDKDLSFLEKFLGDVSKTSATKQIFIGASTGWVTGFFAMRVGKIAAVALGGGIILLEIANERGFVKINWNKINNKLEKVADKVEEQVSGKGPTMLDKVERYVDRQVDKAENLLNENQRKAKGWYSKLTGAPQCQLKEIHIFLVSFVAGVAIGIGTS